jgi:hypothetical protein
MTTELKKLNTGATVQPKKITDRKDFTFSNGVNFGLGLATGFFIFSVVILPALTCAAFMILTMLGVSLGQLAGQ